MAKRLLRPPASPRGPQFGRASSDLLYDFLTNLNDRNKDKLNNLSENSGVFKDKTLIECIFLMTQKLRLDVLVGYHAVETLERFMIKHLEDRFAADDQPSNYRDVVFEELREKFPVIVFSCVQLASKLSLQSRMIDNDAAVRFLHKMGLSVSKQTLLESELLILKGLEYKLNAPNPLVYVEILLEILGHNESSTPVEHLYHLCCHVLQFTCLQRTAIYDSLLMATTQCASPSREQREKFLTVTEDGMLLGVGVIAAATYVIAVNKWEQVVNELNHITGISQKSIMDFSSVMLMHITKTDSCDLST